ncbi:hypothetical protein [cyanobacterium endosymbiont of Rhopalodia gibberula]|uniref:hypothetical protein n=1 Tax=cyanobacterium endosymbiont of Rhopalodia gibberula TaxID=1763363 RepID=UPI000E6501A0|nr:hypothetical protein [cyanobacterium endosymbiont of Rhopalodia gibberula]
MFWIVILYRRIDANLTTTSGIHNKVDLLKVVIVEVKITQMASALLHHGIEYISTPKEGIFNLDGRIRG